MLGDWAVTLAASSAQCNDAKLPALASRTSSPCSRRRRLAAQHTEQRVEVVAAAVHHAVDEDRRRALHLARGVAALDVPANAREHRRPGSVAIEARDVELELRGIAAQVLVGERPLA